eukprot:m51a1_g11116 putative ras guanine nucleotide exchange factor (1535) ;mRNA; r:94500-106068
MLLSAPRVLLLAVAALLASAAWALTPAQEAQALCDMGRELGMLEVWNASPCNWTEPCQPSAPLGVECYHSHVVGLDFGAMGSPRLNGTIPVQMATHLAQDLCAKLEASSKALNAAAATVAHRGQPEEEVESAAAGLRARCEEMEREVAVAADPDHALHMLYQQYTKARPATRRLPLCPRAAPAIRTGAETLIAASMSARSNPFDLGASQGASAAAAKLSHGLEKAQTALSLSAPPLTMAERAAGRASINTSAAGGDPAMAAKITVVLSQECGKALQALQRAVSERSQESYVQALKETVMALNKLMAHSQSNEYGAEGRLRSAAQRIGALSKTAFFNPSDRAAQDSLNAAIRDIAHTLRAPSAVDPRAPDLLALSGVVVGAESQGSQSPAVGNAQAASAAVEVLELMQARFPVLRAEVARLTPAAIRILIGDLDAVISKPRVDKRTTSSSMSAVPTRRAPSVASPDAVVAASEPPSQEAAESSARLVELGQLLQDHAVSVLRTAKSILRADGAGQERLDAFAVTLAQLKEMVHAAVQHAQVCLPHCERIGRGSATLDSSPASTIKRCEAYGAAILAKLREDMDKSIGAVAIAGAPDDAIVAAYVGRDKKRVRDTLLVEVYKTAQLFRVTALHFAAFTAALGANPPELKDVVEVAVCVVACCYTLAQLSASLSAQLLSLQRISGDGGRGGSGSAVDSEVEDAMDSVAPSQDIGHSTPLWKESVPIMLDSAGLFRAGTINHIVTRLTAENHCDTKFMKTCITTYQSFCTPRELLKKLAERYNAPAERLPKPLIEAIRMRVGVALKYWIENQFDDFDRKTVEELLQFIEGFKRDGHATLAQALANEVAQKKKELERGVEMAVDDAPLAAAPFERTLLDALMNTPDDDIARQLTVIDNEMFRRVKAAELLNQNWSKKKARHKSPNILAMIARSNRISFWVASCIVSQAFVSSRSKVVSKFITIGDALKRVRNYNTLMSIIAGLTMSSVQRLQNTFQSIKPAHAAMFQQLQDLMSPQYSFKTYRDALRQQATFAQPYLGTYLTDLTFMGDGNPDLVSNESGQQLINFKKRELVCGIISDLQMLQQVLCPFKPVEPLYSQLLELPQCDEASLYNISLQVEPRGAKRRVTLPSSALPQFTKLQNTPTRPMPFMLRRFRTAVVDPQAVVDVRGRPFAATSTGTQTLYALARAWARQEDTTAHARDEQACPHETRAPPPDPCGAPQAQQRPPVAFTGECTIEGTLAMLKRASRRESLRMSSDEEKRERQPKKAVKRQTQAEARRSVWDYVHDIVTRNNKAPINRLCFVANFTSKLANKKDLTKYYEDFWARQNTEALGPVTGISIVLPASTQRILKAGRAIKDAQAAAASAAAPPGTTTMSLNNALWAGSRGATATGIIVRGEQLMRDVRVVAMAEDVVERTWSTWECRVLQVGRAIELAPEAAAPGAIPEEEAETDNGAVLASQCYFDLMKLGRALGEAGDRVQYEAALENLRATQWKDLVPSADVLASIVACKEVFAIDEFLAVYDGPVNIELDTEQTWTLS